MTKPILVHSRGPDTSPWRARQNASRGEPRVRLANLAPALPALAGAAVLAFAGFTVSGAAGVSSSAAPRSAWLAALPGSGCNIKGNVSQSGERIFHMPGDRYYGETRVNFIKGERWFCSVTEARRAGWRRAHV